MSSTLLMLLLASPPVAEETRTPPAVPAYTVRCEARDWPTHGQVERLLKDATTTAPPVQGTTRQRQVALVHRQIREEGARACRAGATHVEVHVPGAAPACTVGEGVAALVARWRPTA